MYPPKNIDILWRDLFYSIGKSITAFNIHKYQKQIESYWGTPDNTLMTLSVRTGFDQYLQYLDLPPKSEVLVSALTIPDMVTILRQHNLIPVPIDLNIDTLFPQLDLLEKLITNRTKIILVAHLFGNRNPMDELIRIAEKHNILVIEDCAQVFEGKNFKGHNKSDVSLFSFGPIKTATALGGGILHFKNPQDVKKIRLRIAPLPRQNRWYFLYRTLKFCVLKFLSYRIPYRILYQTCRIFRVDHEKFIHATIRSFPGDKLLPAIRKQPAAALVSLLAKRLRSFSYQRLDWRAKIGESLKISLPKGMISASDKAPIRKHWVFAALTNKPHLLIQNFRKQGFDCTRYATLKAIQPDNGSIHAFPKKSVAALSKMVFLPVYAEISQKSVMKMQKILTQIQTDTVDN